MRSIILAIGFLISVISCKNSSEKNSAIIPDNALNTDLVKNPQSASGENKSDAPMPVITFKKETHDFGTVTEGEKVSYSFQFTNTGNADLLITNAAGSCGCTVPEYSKEPVPPGKTGVVNVTFDSGGKQGHQDKTVTIVANTLPNSKVIRVTGEVVKQK
jgi:hypothetical protein